MQRGNNKEHQKKVSDRVKLLMDTAGLELSGFADYLSISESHLYAVLNGTRDLTEDVAERIGAAFDLTAGQVLRVSYRIPKSIKKSKSLNKFYDENKNVAAYFQSTREDRKDSHFIETQLLGSGLFDSAVYIWEVRQACLQVGRQYSSKRLSQILNYLVDTKKLKSEKRPLKLRNGGYGKRVVDVFYR